MYGCAFELTLQGYNRNAGKSSGSGETGAAPMVEPETFACFYLL